MLAVPYSKKDCFLNQSMATADERKRTYLSLSLSQKDIKADGPTNNCALPSACGSTIELDQQKYLSVNRKINYIFFHVNIYE